MFPWSALIGKLIELLLSKVVGKHVDLALDERKRAAKAFLRFYEAVVQVEILAQAFLTHAQPFLAGEQPRLYQAVFTTLSTDADHESTEFLASLRQLHPVLDLYDSDLATLLLGIGVIKGRLITSSFADAMQFGFNSTTKSVFALRYTAPSKRLISIDLAATLETALSTAKTLAAEGLPRSIGWRRDLLLEVVTSNSEAGVIEANDRNELKRLYELVEVSLPMLAMAKDGLRKFIQDRFSFEDLLYATKRRLPET